MSNKIIIWCDGACSGNQFNENIGGWGVKLLYNNHIKEIFGGEKNTTNNRMELTSCIKALETLKPTNIPVEINMDSQYVTSAFNQHWIVKWQQNGWRTAKKEPVENKDLWEQLLKLKEQFDVTFVKVKGHSDNVGNARADELAQFGIDEIKTGK